MKIKQLYSKNYFVLVALTILFIFIRFVIPFNGLYGQDSFEYLRFANRLKEFFTDGKNPGDYFWPIGFPFYGALFSFLFKNVSLSLQLISVVGFLFCFYFTTKILELLHPENKNIKAYLFLFLSISPLFLRSSIVIMSDMACVGFIIASFYFSFRYSYVLNLKYFLAFFFCVANSLMFRYASAVILIPVIIWTIFNAVKKRKAAQILLGFLISLIVFLPHFLIRKENSIAFINHEWLMEWSITNLFKRNFSTNDGMLAYPLPNGIYVLFELFHPGYFIAGIVFIYFTVKELLFNFFEWLLLISIIMYLIFLMGIPLQNSRFFLPLLPLIVILNFKGFFVFINKFKRNTYFLFTMVVIFQIAFFFIFSKKLFERNKEERYVFNYLKEKTTHTVLYSFDMDISLKGYGLQKEFKSLWETKYEVFEHNSLILFNVKAFEKQWLGKNPMLNWEKLNSEYELKSVTNFDNGWELYEIQ